MYSRKYGSTSIKSIRNFGLYTKKKAYFISFLVISILNPLTEESIAQAVVDGLDLGVVLQGVGAELTAKTGGLEATEGSLVGDHVVVVNPDGTSLDGVGNTDSGVDVLGVDTGGKT